MIIAPKDAVRLLRLCADGSDTICKSMCPLYELENCRCELEKSAADALEKTMPVGEHVNDNAKADSGKLTLSWVPPQLITAVCEVRKYGVEKYHNPENWRLVEAQRYWEALLRHTLAAWENWREKDEESGLPHLWHIACNAAFLCAMMEDYDAET